MGFGKKKGGEHVSSDAVPAKKQKKPLTPKEKKRRILIVVLAIVAALLCLAAAATAFFQRPELPGSQRSRKRISAIWSGPKLSGDRKQDFLHVPGHRPRHGRRRQHRHGAAGGL